MCDGCCKRAFHERCCNPPVRIADLEEDEGWLCPACDCRVWGCKTAISAGHLQHLDYPLTILISRGIERPCTLAIIRHDT